MPVVQDAIIEGLTDDDLSAGYFSELNAAVEEARPRIAEMVSLGRMDWEDHFLNLGYDYQELDDLENTLKLIFDEQRTASGLGEALSRIDDLEDEEDLRRTIREFFSPYGQGAARRLVFNHRFPDHTIALAVVVRQMANMADFMLFAESERRAAAALPAEGPDRTEATHAAAQELADLGLAEEAVEWPP